MNMTRSGDIVVLNASHHHIDQITVLYADFVRNSVATLELEPPTGETLHQRFTTLRAQNLPYLVACDGDQVIGWAYASQFGERPGYNITVESSIYIHPDHHRRGVAKLLVRELIAQCSARGKKQMIAATSGDGTENAASIGLHKALGFEQVGVLKEIGVKFGRPIDVMYLQKQL